MLTIAGKPIPPAPRTRFGCPKGQVGGAGGGVSSYTPF